MARKKRERTEAGAVGFGGSLGDLLREKGFAPTSDAAVSSPPASAEAPQALADCRRLHVYVSRKGRRGKTVTFVERVPPHLREATAKALRRALGCGASVDQESLVVQGDQRERVVAWLTAQGARDIRGG